MTHFVKQIAFSRAVLGICACNFLAVALLAQFPINLNLPNTTVTSGTSAYTATNSITAASGFSVSGSASVTFLSGNSIILGPGFTAVAGSASPTFLATIGGVPSALSVSPNSGSGYQQIFSFLASDTLGATYITGLQLLIANGGSYSNACDFWIDRASSGIWLRDDANSTWGAPVIAGQSGTLTNSQCSVNAATSSITPSGNNLTVNLAITFEPAWTGARTVYMEVADAGGLDTGPVQEGTWTVTVNGPPVPVSVTPIDGSTVTAGSAQTVSFVSEDGNGGSYITGLQLLISNGGSYTNACDFWIDVGSKGIWLRDDANTTWGSPVIAGQSGTPLENTHCRVDPGPSSIGVSGDNLTVNLSITLKPIWAGTTLEVSMELWDETGFYTQPATMATWTVTPPPTVTISPTSYSLGWGQGNTFCATVNGVANSPVTWSLSNTSWATLSYGPNNCDDVTAAAYPPPGTPPTLTLTATASDGTRGYATITLPNSAPISVSITSGPSEIVAGPSSSGTFTANTAVTWSISPTVGSIDQYGVYRPPATLAGQQTINVTATSAVDPTKSAMDQLTIMPQGSALATVTTSPAGMTVMVDGVAYTTPVPLQPNTTHMIAVVTNPQNGTQYFSYWSDGGLQSHPITTPASNISYVANFYSDWYTALQNCLDHIPPAPSAPGICTLPAGTYVVNQNQTINLNRYGVTLSGKNTSTDPTVTRLVRGPTFNGPMVEVSVTDCSYTPTNCTGSTETMTQALATQGAVIQNLTFCGGGNTKPNANSIPNEPPLPPAAMSSPTTTPTQTNPCGDQHNSTTTCDYNKNQCHDLDVASVAVDLDKPSTGKYPKPWTYSGPYALEVNNVDLEDAAGHAIVTYATANNTIQPARTNVVNDIYIHNSTVRYAAISGFVAGANFVRYDDKFCDGYAQSKRSYAYADDPILFGPRNIRVENNVFQYNNTGAVAGFAVRWFGLRYNNFYANYLSPPVDGDAEGGGIVFDACADQVDIFHNTFVGPNSATALGKPPSGYDPYQKTGGPELYGRNINIHDNTITGHALDGIGAYSLFQGTITQNHVLQDNDWVKGTTGFLTGGIEIGTASTGTCGARPRDTNGLMVETNDSNPIDVNNLVNGIPQAIPTGPPTQAFGVYLQDHPGNSTDRLYGLTVTSDNFGSLFGFYNEVFLDPFVGLYTYSGVPNTNTIVLLDDLPRFLPIDVPCASSSVGAACNPSVPSSSNLWPIPPLCSDIVNVPPGTSKGSSRAMFKFQASDPWPWGANNIAAIWGIFSVGGSDTIPSSPSATPSAPDQGQCNFMYDAVNNLVYLGDGNGGWLGPSQVGLNDALDLSTQGGCIIHASSSTSWLSQGRTAAIPTAYVHDLTLDVSLPPSPQNKYHVYGYTENQNYNFDTCGYQNATCPAWNYWGYWWNTQ